MNYKILKFKFNSPVHFSNGKLNNGGSYFRADTLFSAICLESLNQKVGVEKLNFIVQKAKNREILLSDSMPFIKEELYLCKPILSIRSKEDGDSNDKKRYKKIEFLPLSQFETYLRGNCDAKSVLDDYKLGIGQKDVRTMVSLNENDSKPFSVASFTFEKQAGLYVILATKVIEDETMIIDILKALGYTGIGGKRSSGFGKFELIVENVPKELLIRLQKAELDEINSQEAVESFNGNIMLLSTSVAKDEELECVLKNANYALEKRSGYVASFEFSNTSRRKRNAYFLKAGSCLQNAFNGQILDVGIDGNHPVYRYGMPIFMEVSL
ncbi:MAG: type III-A CRISPR-associated RAMP protein Csm4 [Anaerovoracaceae bacterium]